MLLSKLSFSYYTRADLYPQPILCALGSSTTTVGSTVEIKISKQKVLNLLGLLDTKEHGSYRYTVPSLIHGSLCHEPSDHHRVMHHDAYTCTVSQSSSR